MRALALRGTRIAGTLAILWLGLALLLPGILQGMPQFRFALEVFTVPLRQTPRAVTVETLYQLPLAAVVGMAALRSAALLLGAALLALGVGLLLGASAAVLRHRALRSGGVLVGVTVLAGVPAFFAAYFLQLVVIFLGGAAGRRILPVTGFGLDEHLILPVLAVGLPAVGITAQIAAARIGEVLDADFITTARAKGLLTSWILRVHVLPHVLPVVLEALGSGLRVSVASLPIVEFLFGWGGIGLLALQSITLKDAAGLNASVLVLAAFFSLFSALLDLPRRGAPA